MVEAVESPRPLQDVLEEQQLQQVVRQALGGGGRLGEWRLVGHHLRRAADGILGFLGDHFRLSLRVKLGESLHEIKLFVKTVPVANGPKAKFIGENHYFKREALVLKLVEELRGFEGPSPWSTRAYIYNENHMVMPDLAVQGFVSRPGIDTLDLPHILLVAASMARFHAAFANYETRKTICRQRPYNILQDYGDILVETTFQDTPWLRAAAKLTANFIRIFSEKIDKYNVPRLEEILAELYKKSCAQLKEYEDTLNVVIHKDLWVNNVMFRYEGGVPEHAVMVDFQCARYAPPAFDFMIMWYLNTSRSFRADNEQTVLWHYYSTFENCLEDCTKRRLRDVNYDYHSFLRLADGSARMFGVLMAAGIYPYVLMDPKVAEKTFDDPETYYRLTHEDRTEPVVAHSRDSDEYRHRILEVSEEFIERYVLKE